MRIERVGPFPVPRTWAEYIALDGQLSRPAVFYMEVGDRAYGCLDEENLSSPRGKRLTRERRHVILVRCEDAELVAWARQ